MSDDDDDDDLVEEFELEDLEGWATMGKEEEQLLVECFFHLEAQHRLFEDEIREALNAPRPVAIDETGWTRIVDYEWTNQPLSARGSMLRGGRFNIGQDIDEHQLQHFPALYIGSNHDTAYHEYFGYFKKGRGKKKLVPHELALREPGSYSACRLSLNLQRVFDLTRKSNLKDYVKVVNKFDADRFGSPFCQLDDQAPIFGKRTTGQERAQLLSINWRYFPTNFGIPSPPQVFGRAVRDAKYEGIKFKSTKGPGYCVAVFPDNLLDASFIELDSRPPDTSVDFEARLTSASYQKLV